MMAAFALELHRVRGRDTFRNASTYQAAIDHARTALASGSDVWIVYVQDTRDGVTEVLVADRDRRLITHYADVFGGDVLARYPFEPPRTVSNHPPEPGAVSRLTQGPRRHRIRRLVARLAARGEG
jgi:hypothetical protein